MVTTKGQPLKKAHNHPYDGISYFSAAREGHQFGYVRGNKIHTAATLEAAVTLRDNLFAVTASEEVTA